MKKILIFAFVVLTILNRIPAQSNPLAEMRGVWVATVLNLDWPDKNKSSEGQKQDFINMLNSLEEININAIFLQVRTECDAFYKSDYEPWSRFLTGTQGVDPGYDPLQFAIEECHKRGMELHAWLNPYRINSSTSDGGSYYAGNHIYKLHPEWALIYSTGKKILNPGLPDVQLYLKKIIGNIVDKYDVDGIHFDDYFYSYDGTPDAMDQVTYQTYGSQYSSIGDFRRGSINKMVKGVFDTINAVKPYVRFGISPFGIYGNGMNPSGIVGLDAYNTIYCDPLAWLNEGTVDYITPQLYWPTGGSQDFGKLLPWWADKAFQKNRQIFAGQGIYRLPDDPAVSLLDFGEILAEYNDLIIPSLQEMQLLAGWTLEEIILQINIIRQNAAKNALGSLYFRANDFERVNNLKEYILDHAYTFNSVLPEMNWKNSPPVAKVENIRIESDPNVFGTKLIWDKNGDDRYALFKIPPGTNPVAEIKTENLIDVIFDDYYILSANESSNDLQIAIVGYDRYWQSGDISELFILTKPDIPVLTSPDNLALVGDDMKMVWQSSPRTAKYNLEIAEISDFSEILFNEEVYDTVFELKDCFLDGEKNYFWRVNAENVAGQSDYSDVREFSVLYPAHAYITEPGQNSETYDQDPLFRFDYTENTNKLHLKLSKDPVLFQYFTFLDTLFDATDSIKFSIWLDVNKDYFAEVSPVNQYGEGLESEMTKFRVLEFVGTDEQLIDEEIWLYPNPVIDELNIRSNTFENISEIKLEIYNLMGKKLYESGLSDTMDMNTFRIPASDLKCNTCYLKITGENFVKTLKFLKF